MSKVDIFKPDFLTKEIKTTKEYKELLITQRKLHKLEKRMNKLFWIFMVFLFISIIMTGINGKYGSKMILLDLIFGLVISLYAIIKYRRI